MPKFLKVENYYINIEYVSLIEIKETETNIIVVIIDIVNPSHHGKDRVIKSFLTREKAIEWVENKIGKYCVFIDNSESTLELLTRPIPKLSEKTLKIFNQTHQEQLDSKIDQLFPPSDEDNDSPELKPPPNSPIMSPDDTPRSSFLNDDFEFNDDKISPPVKAKSYTIRRLSGEHKFNRSFSDSFKNTIDKNIKKKLKPKNKRKNSVKSILKTKLSYNNKIPLKWSLKN
jgi:hypothetical protein